MIRGDVLTLDQLAALLDVPRESLSLDGAELVVALPHTSTEIVVEPATEPAEPGA